METFTNTTNTPNMMLTFNELSNYTEYYTVHTWPAGNLKKKIIPHQMS